MLEIIPLRSVGGISFGQTPEEVIQAWGTPTSTFTPKPPRTLRQYFDAKNVVCHFDALRHLELVTITERGQGVKLLDADGWLPGFYYPGAHAGNRFLLRARGGDRRDGGARVGRATEAF